MKDRNQVIADLLAGSTGQPSGKYVNVLAEDIVLALTPAPEPTPAPPAPTPEDDD